MSSVRFIAAGFFVALIEFARAQSSQPSDGWLMQNYRFTGPPAPGDIKPTDPVISELQEIQNTTLAILRKANFEGDFETALAAAAQATANAQLRGSIAERLQTRKTASEELKPAARYFIALRDGSVQPASSYWVDGAMVHYISPKGAHEQVRLDLVDRRLSGALNRAELKQHWVEHARPLP